MKRLFSRRSFLQLGLASLGGVALSSLHGIQPASASTPATGMGRVAVELVYVYEQPSYQSARIGHLKRDQLIWVLETAESLNLDARNRVWYRIDSGYIHSAYIQPVTGRRNPILESLPATEMLGEITYPFVTSFRFTTGGKWEPLYRLYFGSLHCIHGIEAGPGGAACYRIYDHAINVEYFAPAVFIRLLPYEEYNPLSPDTPAEEKRIVISIADQSLTAYEGEQAVFSTLVSTGLPTTQADKDEIPTDTPTGSFRIRNKVASRHMGDGRLTSDPAAYELPGVPWAMFFHELGFALHGAYWHNNFGLRMSHGCVNLPNPAAKWLFRWSTPVFDPTTWYSMGEGTLLQIK